MLLALLFTLAHAQERDYARERAALDGQVQARLVAQDRARRDLNFVKGLGQIAGRGGVAWEGSHCSATWGDRGDRLVGQLCAGGVCLPVKGLASDANWGGFIDGCRINMNSGDQCWTSFGFRDSRQVHAVYCTKPSLDQVDYLIDLESGRVRQTGFSKRPR